jgi:predicted TIM-barrel fold metal-dependent hydrolase
MELADAQLHLWGPNAPDRPWPPGRDREAQRPYAISKEALLFQMDLAGVQRAILVPPSWEGDRNDLALEAAALYPDRFAVMGRLAVDDPASRGRIAGWKRQPGMLGLRLTFHNEHNRHLLLDGAADWLWPEAERHAVPIMILAPGLLERVDEIAGRFPGLKLVIDHAGLPIRGTPPGVLADLPAVCALARRANVAVKASGLPALSARGFPFSDVHVVVRQLVEAFGPRRTFWGTDLTRMPCTYRECIDLFTCQLPWLAGEDLGWVMGRGLCAWLGWSERAAGA